MSLRLRGSSERLGKAEVSERISGWSLDISPQLADSALLRDMGNRTLLLASNAYTFKNKDGLHGSLIEREDFGQDREDSQHQVRFGQMILNGQGIHEIPDLVAIKPYEKNKHLYHEWAANAYANGLADEQRAYMPLGVYKDDQGTPNLVTLYEHGVTTYDRVFWADKNENPGALHKEVVREAAETCMYGLGLMHGSRLIHGDARAKNLGRDSRHVRFIDLEDATLVPEEAVEDQEYLDKMLKDITMFIDSTMQVEENAESISETLHTPREITRLIKSYRNGLAKARLSQEGKHIPDYAKLHEEAIRDIIKNNQV